MANSRPKLMEKLFSSDMMFETFEVEIDFWENQRYKPLGGWAAPYLGTFPTYSNLLGDKVIDFDKLDQLACLPDGWAWVENQWEFDVPEQRRPEIKSYPIRGETDPDGWSYAGSMETLIKSAQDRLLLSERSAMNTARRRRWRRTRRCVQPTAKKIEAYRRDYVKKTCRAMDTGIDQSTKLATTMQDFHYKWRRSVDNVLRINDKLNKDTAAQLQFVRNKLTLLKECLSDIGQIEAKYAAKLRHFSNKWINAGQRDFIRQTSLPKEEESITRRISMTMLGSSSYNNSANDGNDDDDNSDNLGSSLVDSSSPMKGATAEGEEASEDKGFFSAISRANEEIADHKSVFASSLNSLLPADIDRILSDLEDLIEDHHSETSHTRSQLLMLREVAEETLSGCVSAAFAATRRLSIERSVLMDSLSVVSATWDARLDLVPPLLNEELLDVNNIFPTVDHQAFSASTASSDSANSSNNAHSSGNNGAQSSRQYTPPVGSATQDTWFLLLRYGQTLVQANASMLLLHAQSKVYQRKMTQQCVVVSDLLMSLVKLFAHEHFRCYSEAQSILLDAIGAISNNNATNNGNKQSSSSTEGDAEHDLQLLHSQQLAAATAIATGQQPSSDANALVPGTLKVSQDHVEAIRLKHLQALPAAHNHQSGADQQAMMSHQGLNEEELAAHLATAITPAPLSGNERRVMLGAPNQRSNSNNSNNNNSNNSNTISAINKAAGSTVQMPPLATILPFISLLRSKIICVTEVRFLCLAPATASQTSSMLGTNNSGSSTTSNAGLSISYNSLAANVPQWRWQKAVLVLTHDLCMHFLDLGLPSKGNNVGTANANNGEKEEEKEVTMEEFYTALESGLDNFRVFYTCSVARATVLPLLLTTDARFANTFQVRMHPAYHPMTTTAAAAAAASTAASSALLTANNHPDHNNNNSNSKNNTAASSSGPGSATRAMEAAASSFFSSMFPSSTLSSLSAAAASSMSSSALITSNNHSNNNNNNSNNNQSSSTMVSSSSANLDSTTTSSSSTLINLSSVISVFAGSQASSSSASFAPVTVSTGNVSTMISTMENVHANGRYQSVHCEPRAANTFHATTYPQSAHVCSIIIAPFSAATSAMLMKKLTAPFCDVHVKTPESYANDILANPSAADPNINSNNNNETVSGPQGTLTSSSSSSLASSSSTFTTTNPSSFSTNSFASAESVNSTAAEIGMSSSVTMMSAVSVIGSSSSLSVTTNNNCNNSSTGSGGNSPNIGGSNSTGHNAPGASSGSANNVAIMANPMMKNPLLKRTTSAVMKKQQQQQPAPVAPVVTASTSTDAVDDSSSFEY